MLKPFQKIPLVMDVKRMKIRLVVFEFIANRQTVKRRVKFLLCIQELFSLYKKFYTNKVLLVARKKSSIYWSIEA